MSGAGLPFLWGVPSALREAPRWRVPGAVPFAFRPSTPSGDTRRVVLTDGRAIRLRGVRPLDAAGEQRLLDRLSLDTRYFRFHSPIRQYSPDLLRRMVAPGDRQFALVAEDADPAAADPATGDAPLVADARWVLADDADDLAEFAIVVADGWQRAGLGARLLAALVEAARERGVRALHGDVLHDNLAMAALLRRVGGRFAFASDPRVRRAVITID